MVVYILTEPVDLGDRIRGAFATEAEANDAARKLAIALEDRYGGKSGEHLSRLSIEAVTLGELLFP